MLTGVAEIVVWCGVLTGVAVVSISSVSPVELVVAGTGALGGAFAARRMRLAADVGFRNVPGALRAALSLPHAILRGVGVLVSALAVRPAKARTRRIRLRPGADAGWAAAMLAASPDTCVLDIPRPDEVVTHTLSASPGPVERLVAEPGGPA